MSAEQGDVAAIREALQRYGHLLPTDAFNELRRNCHAVAAALEMAERGLDNARTEETRLRAREALRVTTESNRAEKAERALGEMRAFVVWAVGEEFDPDGYAWQKEFLERARAALRPSEKASDES